LQFVTNSRERARPVFQKESKLSGDVHKAVLSKLTAEFNQSFGACDRTARDSKLLCIALPVC
jgi:hypothetical protein